MSEELLRKFFEWFDRFNPSTWRSRVEVFVSDYGGRGLRATADLDADDWVVNVASEW
jgi:hypothetical protein